MAEKESGLWVPAGTCIPDVEKVCGTSVLRSGSGCCVKDALVREWESGKKQARTL